MTYYCIDYSLKGHDCMNIYIPENVVSIIERLESHGFEAYAVGGCVRDAILGKTPKDYDISTSAKPEEIKKCFEDYTTLDTGIKHGTITVISENQNIEVTTFRIDGKYNDSRHPESVKFSDNLLDDLSRRDFTINSMAYNPKTGVIDKFGAQKDMFNRRIACVGKPSVRFGEDALRIMRALRFASELEFDIEEKTASAIHEMKDNLLNISIERVAGELMLLLTGVSPYNILTQFSDVLAVIIPEIKPCIGFDQHSRYHVYDVWKHSAAAVEHSIPDPIVRLSLFLHDIGKPHCFKLDDEGNGQFFNHEKIGSEMAVNILRHMHFPNNTTERVSKLIKYHYVIPLDDYKVVRKLLSAVGEDDFPLLIEIMKGNNRAKHSSCFERIHTLEAMQAKAKKIIEEHQCISVADLAVSGNDMITVGYQGSEIGNILGILLDAVMDDKVENTYSELIDFAKKYHSDKKI